MPKFLFMLLNIFFKKLHLLCIFFYFFRPNLYIVFSDNRHKWILFFNHLFLFSWFFLLLGVMGPNLGSIVTPYVLFLFIRCSTGSAVGLVVYSDTITIVFEPSTQTLWVQSPTLPVRFFYTAGPGRKLSILKGSVTRVGGAVVYLTTTL